MKTIPKTPYFCSLRSMARGILTLFSSVLLVGGFGAGASAGEIAAGGNHSLVLAADGTAWSWGKNDLGQLGLGHLLSADQPQRVHAGVSFSSLAAGEAHTFALAADGRLFGWGRNEEGQLGLGNVDPDLVDYRGLPIQVGSSDEWEAVAAGWYHTIGIQGGRLYGWGSNSAGQVGNDSFSSASTPVQIGAEGIEWVAVAAGEFHSLAIDADGKLWAWGSNLEGQLGLGAVTVQRVPAQVGEYSNWKSLAAGAWHSLAVREDGTLWTWGRNGEGQTGLGFHVSQQMTPRQLGSESNWQRVAAGSRHSAAVREDGTLWCWGSNSAGQLGDGSVIQRWIPVRIGAGVDWSDVSAGGRHTIASSEGGQVFAAGLNSSGQLGFGFVSDPVHALGATLYGLPDFEVLTVSMPSVNPPESVGSLFTVTVAGKNSGSGVAAPDGFGIEIRLTNTETWGEAGDIVLKTAHIVTSLGVGETFEETFELSLAEPVPAGYYYIAVSVDPADEIDEIEVENNLGWSAEKVAFLPDLRVGEIDRDPVAVMPGDTMTLEIPIENHGTGTYSGTGIGVTLHLATFVDLGSESRDVLLARTVALIDELAGGGGAENTSISATVPVATPPGNYFLVVILDEDNVIEESDDTNNHRGSNTTFIEVGGISLAGALGHPDLAIGQSWNPMWHGEAGDGFFSDSVATVGGLAAGDEAWFEMTVESDSQVTFRWKAATFHEDNRMVFTVDDGGVVEIGTLSGQTDWERVTVAVSAGAVLRWSYQQGADTTGDAVYVDGLQITAQGLPDFTVAGTDYLSGVYVLDRDSIAITATGINLGAFVQLPPGFKMSAYLSASRSLEPAENLFLGDLGIFRNLDANNRFVYASTLALPSHIPAGDYHLLLIVDSGNVVDESDTANNIWFSNEADILIERRPDLEVSGIVYNGDHVVHGDELTFELTIFNSGLADVLPGQRFDIALFLSTEMAFGSAGEIPLASFSETFGILAGESLTYGITVPAPVGVSFGEMYHVGAYVDVNGAVAESNEANNLRFSPVPDLVFSQVALDDALGIAGLELDLVNGGEGMTPWFGQTEESFSGGSAAQSGRIGDGQRSVFELTVDLADPVVVSFYWKVSSELMEGAGGVKEDALRFLTDDVEHARISGEVDWTRVTLELPAGVTTLTWEYLKDGSGSVGTDAGWVDALRFDPAAIEVSLEEALDDELNPLPGGWIDSGWRTGLGRPWQGQEDRLLFDGSSSSFDEVDSARSSQIGIGEESWLEREIEVSPTGPAKVTFRWKVSSAPETDYLAFSISNEEKARISGAVDWREEEFLIPAGPQILRWSYRKTGSQSVGEDAAFLDQVEIVALDLPDLVITDVKFEPGEYVLERDRLPLQVTVENRGAALSGVQWSTSDLAVRLSKDTEWGSSGDVILGNFAKVETFDSGRRLVFSGSIALPLDAPSGDYFLAILADPFEKIEEWSRENNFYLSAGRDVSLTRLPNLILDWIGMDDSTILFPLSTLEFGFEVRNIGLGDVPGGHPYGHRIELRARLVDPEEGEEEEGPPATWIDAEVVAVLADISESAYMPGVSDQRPIGSQRSYDTRLTLPGELELLKALGIISEQYTTIMVRDEERLKLAEWEFSLVLTLDVNHDIVESDEANVYGPDGIGLFSIQPLLGGEAFQSMSDWAAEYDLVLPEPGTEEYATLLRQYALNLNPGGSVAGTVNQYGFVAVDGSEYLRLTFEMVKGATDLRYTVEVSDNLVEWSPLVVLEPPYLGQHSLTGVGGLTGNPLILAAADQGYTAAMTIRDGISVEDAPSRFLRLKIEQISP